MIEIFWMQHLNQEIEYRKLVHIQLEKSVKLELARGIRMKKDDLLN